MKKTRLNFRNLEIRKIYVINEVNKMLKTVCLNIVSLLFLVLRTKLIINLSTGRF